MNINLLNNLNMKNFVKIGFVAVFAAIAGYGVYTSQKSELMSDLALANVEALAQSESGGNYKYVYYPQPGDPNYGYTKCVCSGSGSLSCC